MRTAIFVSMTVMAGCASPPTTASGEAFAVDERKMGAIEHQATQLGLRVMWVNPPRKPAPAPGS
jgi:hypothetical protein